MDVIRWNWEDVSRGDTFRIIPIADVHLGLRTCDENALAQTVKRIADDDACYWGSMGDLADFINRSDKRFDPASLAPWLMNRGDLAGAQRDRLIEILSPIAAKCLWMLSGNHEDAIRLRYERDIFAELVMAMKQAAGYSEDRRLGLGSCGWLMLQTHRSKDKGSGATIRIAMHHGYVAGRLAGGQALELERWLSCHDCDVGLLGHSHKVQTMAVDTESVDRNGNITFTTRKGAICGSFLDGGTGPDTYMQKKGYRHAPVGTVTLELRPGAERQADRVKMVT